MNKKVLFGEEAQAKLLKGAKILHDAVSTTLSPRGKNVGFYGFGEIPITIHDGVKVANEISLADYGENFAVKILRESAQRQVSQVGDGTTVSIILAYAIYKECMRNIAAGTNAMTLRQGLEEGRDLLLAALEEHAIPVKTVKQAVEIATISAADPKLGKQIGELVFKLGVEGVITVERSNLPETQIEMQEGMQFDKGYASPYFITDPERSEATVEDTAVLITDKNVVNINEFLPLFNDKWPQAMPKNLVIIAPEISDSALAAFIVNKARGTLNVLCVKAPYTGQQQLDMLNDIAVLTGGQVITQAAGMRFENIDIEMLGRAKRITSTKDATMIVGGQGDKAEIDARVKQLKAEQERDEAVSDYQIEKLKERIAKLSGGIAVINVGGATEVEINERFERADDAQRATQAALKEGIIPGGEIIYLKLREKLDTKNIAHNILYNALEKPFSKLLENAGMKPDAFINILENNTGVDVVSGQKTDMIKSGIVDPTLVASQAIINSISTAISLMTTEVLILPVKEDKEDANRTA